MRNKRQTAIGVGSNVRRVIEGELQKQLDACREEARLQRAAFGLALQRYGHHLGTCPWAAAAPDEPCTCGFHDLVARMLPTDRVCAYCHHQVGFHIRTAALTTFCIGREAGVRCECRTDPSPNVAMLDAIVGRRPPQPLKGD